MQKWIDQFNTVALPFRYVQVPQANEPVNKPSVNLKFYVKNVMTHLTRDVFLHSGFTGTTDPRRWNASWGQQYSREEYQKCEGWQKINHFAGAFLMGRKDNLHDRMLELQSRVGESASFYPETYLLPRDRERIEERWKGVRTWILKPSASSRGEGIRLVNSKDSEVPEDYEGIVQVYLLRPMLITKRKFDVRLYLYVPSIEPLRVYMHRSGMIRLCTHEYDLERGKIDDYCMHLTNFNVNEKDRAFVACEGLTERVEDSKWSLDFFMEYMERNGHDSQAIMKEFENVAIQTIIAGLTTVRKIHFREVPHRHTAHELYGIDIMLDEDGKAHLMEINISPSMGALGSPLDRRLKYPVNLDMLRMGRIIECDPELENPCPAVDAMDERYFASMTTLRMEDVESGNVNPWDEPVFADFVIIRDFLEEQQIKSGFKMIFPVAETMDRYTPCFDKLSYQDIVLHTWLKLSDAEKERVLTENFDVYTEELRRISNPEPHI